MARSFRAESLLSMRLGLWLTDLLEKALAAAEAAAEAGSEAAEADLAADEERNTNLSLFQKSKTPKGVFDLVVLWYYFLLCLNFLIM